MPGYGWMAVKCAAIVSDELMQIYMVPAYLSVSSGERDGVRKRGNKIWPFAQKNNNCSSVRVTLRCGLLFAPSVTTGWSPRGREGSLTNDYVARGGDGTLFQGLRQQYTTSRGSRRLNQRSDYDLHGPNKDDAVPAWGKKKAVSFCLLLFSSQAFESDLSTSRACLLTFCLPPAVQRGFCSSRLRTTQIFTCGITTAQHGKENIQGLGAK